MSLQTRLMALINAIAADYKSLRAELDAAVVESKIIRGKDSSHKIFHNPLTWRGGGQGVPGQIVIETPITFTAKMCKITVKGYNYLSGQTDIDLTVGFYAYNNTSYFLNHGTTNKGTKKVNVKLFTKDSDSTAVIVLESEIGTFNYPQISVTEAEVGFSNAPDSWLDGWSASLKTDLTGYTERVTPSKVDLSLVGNWTFTGTTEINGGAIRAGTIVVGQSQVTGLPAALNSKATPAQVATAKSEAISIAASDATTKANAAVTAHEAAEDPHPQYFRKGQPLQSSTSTPEGTSSSSLDEAGASGQFTTRFYTGDPEVEGTLGGGWSVSTDGLTASSSQTEKSTANPVYYEREEQEISLTRFGITAELTQTVNNEAGYSQELLGGTTLKFPSGITKLTLPATGNVATPETLSTREWVRARDSAHVAAENPHPQYFRRDQPIQGSTSAPGTGSYGISEMGAFSSRVYDDQEYLVQLDTTLGLLISRKDDGQAASFVSNPEGILRLGYGALNPNLPDVKLAYPGTGSEVETFATREWVADQPVVEMTHYGTGNPNGVVAAPVGSVFRNTEDGGWNGARVWRKDTGTGNTGWVVESGDTGWRDLSPYLVNGAAKGGAAAPAGGVEPIRIRRSGDTVTLIASVALPTWVSGQAALDFPHVGFSSPMQYMPPGYSNAPLVVLNGGQMRFYTTVATSAARYMWTWVTWPTWPTTLPGTPA